MKLDGRLAEVRRALLFYDVRRALAILHEVRRALAILLTLDGR